MFGINGMEMLVLALLFLVLFGPERLPEAAMQIARWVGRLRAMSDQATAEIRREFAVAIREAEEARAELERMTTEARDAARDVERHAKGAYEEAQRGLAEDEARRIAPHSKVGHDSAAVSAPDHSPDQDHEEAT